VVEYHGAPAEFMGWDPRLKPSKHRRYAYAVVLPGCQKPCCEGKGLKVIRADLLTVRTS
jgi:hypothetical protein